MKTSMSETKTFFIKYHANFVQHTEVKFVIIQN